MAHLLRYLCDTGEIWEVERLMSDLTPDQLEDFWESIHHDSWLRNSIKACQQAARGVGIDAEELTPEEMAGFMRNMK